MLVLELEFLSGRFYGSDPTDRSRVEWPPHPSRLFSALVATHHGGGVVPAERLALEWLETQEAPKIAASAATVRTTPRVYVPTNDPKQNKEDVIPEARTKKDRFFPSATPINPCVHYIWALEPESEIRSSLESLARKVVCVGHSSSLVRLSIKGDSPEPNWIPDPKGTHQFRTPVHGQLVALEEAFSQHRGIRPRALPTGFTSYRNASNQSVSQPWCSAWDDQWFGLRISPRANLRSTLALTEAFRGALMALGPQPLPEWISGHEQEGAPTRQPHISIIPLADVGHRHSRGLIMGLAALLPRNLGFSERGLLAQIVASIPKLAIAGSEFQVELLGERPDRWTLDVRTWSGPSVEWASVTPVVFDRYPKDPSGDEAKEVIRKSCRDVGLPDPVDVAVQGQSPLIGSPSAGLFPARQRLGKPSRWHSHVILRFDQPISGPLVIGAGRHHGYGLMKPWRSS
jgi:CRISPR-associated protein Csb2